MNYSLIGVVLVPCLGYLSYVVLILWEIARQKNYAQHVVVNERGLFDQAFQKGVKNRAWINLPFLMGWMLVGGMLFVLSLIQQEIAHSLGFDYFQLVLGITLTIPLLSLATTVGTLFLFRYAADNPEELTGQVQFKGDLMEYQRLYHMISLTVPLLIVAAYEPGPFSVGAVSAGIITLFKQWYALRKLSA